MNVERDGDPFDLGGRRGLVTGAAGGIGEAVAWRMAERGARSLLVDRDDRVEQVASDISRRHGERAAIAYVGDLTDEAVVTELTGHAEAELGGLDVLVATAGVVQRRARVLDITTDEWDRVVDVNAKSTFLLARGLVPLMNQDGAGSIVTFSSIAGGVGLATAAAYCASKAAIDGFSRALALELAPAGIRVNAVAPGVVDTALGRRAMQGTADLRGVPLQQVLDERVAAIPLARMATPEEIADCVVFLASDASRYVTGTTLEVNGGMLLGF